MDGASGGPDVSETCHKDEIFRLDAVTWAHLSPQDAPLLIQTPAHSVLNNIVGVCTCMEGCGVAARGEPVTPVWRPEAPMRRRRERALRHQDGLSALVLPAPVRIGGGAF